MDAIARVWDCRSGRNVHTCEGHVKAVLSLDWSPCGYLLATGSEDNTARVWDLRKRGVVAILPGGCGGGLWEERGTGEACASGWGAGAPASAAPLLTLAKPPPPHPTHTQATPP